jgi:hypothetical protein
MGGLPSDPQWHIASNLLYSTHKLGYAAPQAVISSHLYSFTLDGEKYLGIAASRILPWVKLHWRVESALLNLFQIIDY